MNWDDDLDIQTIEVPPEGKQFRLLWLSILLRGVQDFCLDRAGDLPSDARRPDGEGLPDIKEWFWSDDESYPGSFVRGCQLLPIEPAKAREHVMRNWRAIAKGRHGTGLLQVLRRG